LVPRTRCQILRLKCTKFAFRWGCAPDTAAEITALPSNPYSWGLLLTGGRGRYGRGMEGERKGKGQGRGEEVEGGIWHVAPYAL